MHVCAQQKGVRQQQKRWIKMCAFSMYLIMYLFIWSWSWSIKHWFNFQNVRLFFILAVLLAMLCVDVVTVRCLAIWNFIPIHWETNINKCNCDSTAERMTEHILFKRQKDQSNEMFTLNDSVRVANHVPFHFNVEN